MSLPMAGGLGPMIFKVPANLLTFYDSLFDWVDVVCQNPKIKSKKHNLNYSKFISAMSYNLIFFEMIRLS